MSSKPKDPFKEALAAEEIRGAIAEEYLREADANPEFAKAMIDSTLPRLRTSGAHLANGTEQPVELELNDEGEAKFVAVSPDPSDEIAARIDGPPLLDKESGWEHFADGLMRLFDWMRGHTRVGKIPPHDVGVRCLTVIKQLFPSLTASELEERYGLSRQSISQQTARFRKEFGEVPTLRTRTPAQRQRMSEAQSRVNHWHKEKPPKPKVTPEVNEAENLSKPSLTSEQHVNCETEVAP